MAAGREPSQTLVVTNPSPGFAMVGGVEKQRAAELKGHMVNLNESFFDWVKSQMTSSSSKFLSNGLRDYLNHASKLQDEFKDVVNGDGGDQQKPDVSANGFGSSSLLFPPGKTPTTGNGLGGAPPQFNFGHNFAGAGEAKKVSAPSAVAATTKKSPVASADKAGDAAEDAAFESKSKVLKFVKGEWNDLGVGFLSVVKPEGGGKAFICFRSLTTKKVLFRAGLYDKIQVKIVKKSANLVLFPAKEERPPVPGMPPPAKTDEDEEAKPTTFSFRFGKVETVNAFKVAVEANA